MEVFVKNQIAKNNVYTIFPIIYLITISPMILIVDCNCRNSMHIVYDIMSKEGRCMQTHTYHIWVAKYRWKWSMALDGNFAGH